MEKILTKYFWVFNGIVLALIAFFLAQGTGEIVASELSDVLPADGAQTTPMRQSRTSFKPAFWTPPDGTPILKRNIFDSVQGPLDGSAETAIEDAPVSPTGDLPLVPCSPGKVQLMATVASKEDIMWSFASITEGGTMRLCRMGDEVDGRIVSGITWRYLFLRGTTDECYVDIFGEEGVSVPAQRVAGAPGEGGNEELSNSIQKVSDTEHVVDRGLVDKLLADPTQFIRSVRVRPVKQNGETVGFKLRRFQPDSPLAMLGAQKGDIIHAVNGMQLTSVDKALAAYQGLRSAGDLTFSITRNGQPMELSVRIR